ncbi:hypothetical protein F4782DRAFT_510345 [Xylaria castorea]|nr:hypothetical protein F4782DRAFT_510345 [Xylaria castorea]
MLLNYLGLFAQCLLKSLLESLSLSFQSLKKFLFKCFRPLREILLDSDEGLISIDQALRGCIASPPSSHPEPEQDGT